MRVLAIGDVCGSAGCEALGRLLPAFKKRESVDFVIANGENSADGNGLSPRSADLLFAYGVDVITGGNHTLKRREICSALDESEYLLRPDNFDLAEYGCGYRLIDCGYTRIAVFNLSGTVYLESCQASSPFDRADRLIQKAQQDGAVLRFLDFHAEATSEKRAMGFYLDGKVSAVFGTHTHVQTADAQILPGGTGYITDLGMTGPIHSVLGIEPSIIIRRFQNPDSREKFTVASGPCVLSGCLFDVDPRSGLCTGCRAVCLHEGDR